MQEAQDRQGAAEDELFQRIRELEQQVGETTPAPAATVLTEADKGAIEDEPEPTEESEEEILVDEQDALSSISAASLPRGQAPSEDMEDVAEEQPSSAASVQEDVELAAEQSLESGERTSGSADRTDSAHTVEPATELGAGIAQPASELALEASTERVAESASELADSEPANTELAASEPEPLESEMAASEPAASEPAVAESEMAASAATSEPGLAESELTASEPAAEHATAASEHAASEAAATSEPALAESELTTSEPVAEH
ncbi:unnamed protein product, partial [Symbiodinium pilosum]